MPKDVGYSKSTGKTTTMGQGVDSSYKGLKTMGNIDKTLQNPPVPVKEQSPEDSITSNDRPGLGNTRSS